MLPAEQPIIVASAVDAGYLPLTEIVATSIAANARPDSVIEYHVLYSGPDNATARRLETWRRRNVQLHLHRVSNPMERYGTMSGFPPSSLLRVLIPDMLPGYARCIYLDADLVVEADLRELFETSLDGKPLGAVIDRGIIEWALKDWPQSTDMRSYLASVVNLRSEDDVRDYRQSGIMLMDLEALRAIDYNRIVCDAIERYGPVFRFSDQCIMNLTMRGRIAELDPRWNATTYGMEPERRTPAMPGFEAYANLQRTDPRIVHFAGIKPWNTLRTPFWWRWWRYAVASGRAGDFLPNLSKRTMAAVRRRLPKFLG